MHENKEGNCLRANKNGGLLFKLQNHAAKCEMVKAKNYRFLAMQILKQETKNHKKESVYNKAVFKVLCYRSIFFTFAMLFILLAIIAISQNLTVATILLGNFNLLPRLAIASFSLILAIIAAMAGFSLCIAEESARMIIDSAISNAKELYVFDGLSCISTTAQQQKKLRNTYQSIVCAIREQEEETAFLLRRIQKSNRFNKETKSMLFAQALQETENELQKILLKVF